jgi:aspartate aminotransferase
MYIHRKIGVLTRPAFAVTLFNKASIQKGKIKMSTPVSERSVRLLDSMLPIFRFLSESTWSRRRGEAGIGDFTIGNPHDMPSPELVSAYSRWIEPRDKHWYAYKMNETASREVLAGSLRQWRNMPFEMEDIFVTNGAIAALAVVLGTIVDPGDEVIFISPPWFQYEGMILNVGGVPVRIKARDGTFDLDLPAIEEAIGPKTRAVIINSPQNPTGRIYQPEILNKLAGMLAAKSRKSGRTVYLISDEAYSRIVFDGKTYPSPVSFYPESFMVYTYGKVLLAPGERIGFIALPPEMSEKATIRKALSVSQMINGWSFPNALLQHAIGDLDRISIDITHLQRKRDRLYAALTAIGYEVLLPEGTFYMLVRSPCQDDEAFIELLARHDIFCIPGSAMEIPGYFRICFTPGDETIERALPGFDLAFRQAAMMEKAQS